MKYKTHTRLLFCWIRLNHNISYRVHFEPITILATQHIKSEVILTQDPLYLWRKQLSIKQFGLSSVSTLRHLLQQNNVHKTFFFPYFFEKKCTNLPRLTRQMSEEKRVRKETLRGHHYIPSSSQVRVYHFSFVQELDLVSLPVHFSFCTKTKLHKCTFKKDEKRHT